MDTASSQDRNSDKASAEENVEDDGREGEKGNSAEEAGEDNGECGVDDGSAGDALKLQTLFHYHDCEDEVNS